MNTNNPVTYDFSDFGYRELKEAIKLLTAYTEHNDTGHCLHRFGEGVKVGFNRNSGYIWLRDGDFNILMLDDNDQLYQFYFLGYAGTEGSAEELFEMFEDGEIDPEDYEQLADILEDEDMTDEAEAVRDAMEKEEE